jgi:flagellar basal-body rod protein FlgC
MSMNMIGGIQSSSAALNAERIRMEVISQNIANADVSRTASGAPYERQHVVFENVLRQQQGLEPDGGPAGLVQVSKIVSDHRPPRLAYMPGHPDANPANGMVALPDINIHEEMADLIAASRAFEANLAVVKNARQMAMQSLSIGKV